MKTECNGVLIFDDTGFGKQGKSRRWRSAAIQRQIWESGELPGDGQLTHRVVSDADYSDNPAFLNSLEARHECYVVGVRANFSMALAWRGTAAPQRDCRKSPFFKAAPPGGVTFSLCWDYTPAISLRECFLSGRIRLENDQIQPNLPDRPQVYRMATNFGLFSNQPDGTPTQVGNVANYQRHPVMWYVQVASGA